MPIPANTERQRNGWRAPSRAVSYFGIALILLGMPLKFWAADLAIAAVDFSFTSASLTIAVGDTITWTNLGSFPHTVTADNGSFDSGTLNPGNMFTRVFSTAGIYPYHCIFHGAAGGIGMAGVITVSADPPTISLNPASLSFTAAASGSNPASKAIAVSNSGGGTLNWTATATTTSGGSWLSVEPTSGSGPDTLIVSPNIAGLSAGDYDGSITVQAPGATNTPQIVPVTLHLDPARRRRGQLVSD